MEVKFVCAEYVVEGRDYFAVSNIFGDCYHAVMVTIFHN